MKSIALWAAGANVSTPNIKKKALWLTGEEVSYPNK